MSEGDEDLRWSAVITAFATGIALTALAIYCSVELGWQGIWPEFLLGWGTTIALGAALFAVQRTFVRNVRLETKAAVNDAANRVTTKVTDLQRELGDRVANLEQAIAASENITENRRAEGDSLIEDMRASPSRESFSKPLIEASRLGAVDLWTGFRVRASRAVDGLR
jgi:hypothetical protein